MNGRTVVHTTSLVGTTLLLVAWSTVVPAVAGSTTTTTSTTSTTVPTTTTTRPGQPTTSTSSTTMSTTSTTTTTMPGLPPEELDPEHHEYDAIGEDFTGQLDFDPATREVVAGQLDAARTELFALETDQGLSVFAIADLEDALAAVHERIEELDAGRRNALSDTELARLAFEEAAVQAYVRGSDLDFELVFDSETVGELLERTEMIESVLEADHASIDEYLDRRAALDDELTELLDEKVSVTRDLKAARLDEKERRVAVAEARVRLAVWEAGSQVMAEGFVFPVFGEVQFGDSWGAPRMAGTPDEHWHEGTDIMAAADTPLVAVENGHVLWMKSHSLGGIGLQIQGRSGLRYYYAHLSAYAPGISAGQEVTAGQIIGFVGDTGNAKGGSPHLHFEVEREGEAVNPYPILRVTWDWQAPYILAAADELNSLDDALTFPGDAGLDAVLDGDEEASGG